LDDEFEGGGAIGITDSKATRRGASDRGEYRQAAGAIAP